MLENFSLSSPVIGLAEVFGLEERINPNPQMTQVLSYQIRNPAIL
jgi:hypothetical protein